jgi:tRNA dimethylallyltransferase
MDSLIKGNDFAPFPSTGMREKLELQADREGMQAMHTLLASIDPESADRLPAADRKRILRALEVYYETGETITEHNRRTQQIPPRYTPLWLGLDFEDRAELYSRIDLRVDLMLEMGLMEEIRSLLASGIPEKSTAMQAIGYKEFVNALNGNGTLAAAAEEVKKSSRHYAKRQLTWFRRNPNMHWLTRKPAMRNEEILAMARQVLHENDN